MGDSALYRPILKKAWQITTKFKSLWFLGLFAAILSSGGEFELLSKVFFTPASADSITVDLFNNFKLGLTDGLQAGEGLGTNIWASISSSPASLISAILVLIVGLAITGFFIWLAIVSQVGLIKNIDLASKNKKITINGGIDEGVERFWPILGVNFAYKIVLLILFILLAKEFLLLYGLGTLASVVHIISLTIFAVIVVFVSFVVRYQIIYMILTGKKAMDSLKLGWGLFKNNWLISLEMAFILFIVYTIAAYLTVFTTAIFLAIPLVFLAYANQIPIIVIALIGLMSFLAVFATTFFITAFVSTFNWSAWTLLFGQINKNKGISSIIRLSERSPNINNPFSK